MLEIGTLYETIVAVFDARGSPHVSPAGARVIDQPAPDRITIEMKVFDTAVLHEYLERERCCVVHFPTNDQLDLFLLGFKRVAPVETARIMAGLAFSPAGTVHAPLIGGIPAFIEARVAGTRREHVRDAITGPDGDASGRNVFLLESTRISPGIDVARPFTRRDGLFMEFLVDASRLALLPDDAERERVHDLLQQRLGLLRRLAPRDARHGVLGTLLERVFKDHGASGDP